MHVRAARKRCGISVLDCTTQAVFGIPYSTYDEWRRDADCAVNGFNHLNSVYHIIHVRANVNID
jgi:hypothetical protein